MKTLHALNRPFVRLVMKSLAAKLALLALLALSPYIAQAKGAPIVLHVKDQTYRKMALQAEHPEVMACIKSVNEKVLEPTSYRTISWTVDALIAAQTSKEEHLGQILESVEICAIGKSRDANQSPALQKVVVVCTVVDGQPQQVSVVPR